MLKSVWVTWPALAKYGSVGVTVALLSLAADREALFRDNLIDVEEYDNANAQITCDERSRIARTEDGTCNILENPVEGSVYRRFGRNVQLEAAYAETEAGTLLTPNPRDVSNTLMARDELKPARSLNFIASAWIQFMTHDWFSHGPNKTDDQIEFPLPEGDVLGSGTMSVQRTMPDPNRTAEDDAKYPATYRNVTTHWWDGSQLYGSNKATSDAVRSFVDGKLKVNADKTLPQDANGNPVTGFNDNWWLGLSMLHQLFVLEHNAIADRLKQEHPEQTDQWLYDKARLVNAALMAKIHTIEWTPAVLANPVLERGMHANWYGLIGNREGRDGYQNWVKNFANTLAQNDLFLQTVFGFNPDLSGKLDSTNSLEHAIGGLVGSREPDNAGTPYTLTEEFVAVYRMHPLMRDEVQVFDIGTNVQSKSIPIQDTRNGDAEEVMAREGADRLWYSMGITYPGALTLKNYPEFLRNLSIPTVGNIDLATIDILRDRERGIPRYNEFRRQIKLKPIERFEDLTTDPTILAELKRLYNNDIEQIDTLVGQLAETVRPEGFGFGETAFQIFIMNASRRLLTDRFYTKDYTPEMYTQAGYDWVENNDMKDVVLRHFPQLAGSMSAVENVFKPWGIDIPEDYQSLSACKKQQHLWGNGVQRTKFNVNELPKLTKIDVFKLVGRILSDKVEKTGDVAPAGYVKPIHAHGVMAPVSFTAEAGTPYTGLFEGSDCGLLRLSVTGDPNDRGFAPGLAWKAFVDGKRSENVSALYTLSGQGDDRNFFANELSQYVSVEGNETLGTTFLFSFVSSKPTRLMVDDMAKVDQNGNGVSGVNAPTQIYFVPNPVLKAKFAGTTNDFRVDLMSLPAGTKLYDVYATSEEVKTSIFSWVNKGYADSRRNNAIKIGEMTMTEAMAASSFGDSGVFFKHQRYEDK